MSVPPIAPLSGNFSERASAQATAASDTPLRANFSHAASARIAFIEIPQRAGKITAVRIGIKGDDYHDIGILLHDALYPHLDKFDYVLEGGGNKAVIVKTPPGFNDEHIIRLFRKLKTNHLVNDPQAAEEIEEAKKNLQLTKREAAHYIG